MLVRYFWKTVLKAELQLHDVAQTSNTLVHTRNYDRPVGLLDLSSTSPLEERSDTHLRWTRPPGNIPEPLESLFLPGCGAYPTPMKPVLRHYLEKFGSQGNYCNRCVRTAG